MLRITLPWSNYTGPFGGIEFSLSIATVEGDKETNARKLSQLNAILPGILVAEVDAPAASEAPAPKPRPKPLALKPLPLPKRTNPVAKVELETADEDIDEVEEEETNVGPTNEDGDMMADDRLPPTVSTTPTQAEIDEAAARMKKLGIKGIGPRLPGGPLVTGPKPKPAKKPKKKGKRK